MQKTKKNSHLIKAAVIFFIISALLFCGGMFALGWDFSSLDISEYTEKSWTDNSGADISVLSLKVSGRDVVVNSVEGSEINAEWFDSKSHKVEVCLENGKLEVKEKFRFVFGPIFFRTNREKNKLIVNIPASSLDNLNISVSGGTLEINGITTVGKIDYNQSGGVVKLNGAISTGSLNCNVSGGTLKLDNLIAGSVAFRQSGGRVDFNNVVTDSMTCDNSGGALKVKDFSVNKLEIKISGGDISGSLEGDEADYVIAVNKSGGRCNLKEKDGVHVSQKWIKVKQSGGNVGLGFKVQINIEPA